VANTVAAAVGGLPMISEIVRSKVNIDNGARTRAANFCHGLCLLAFVLLFPDLIHRIPLAALGAMLVYTGFRLANPREFVRTYRVGAEQLVVFVGTILATLATDLLIGISIGIGLEVVFHLWFGAPVKGLVKSDVEAIPVGDDVVTLVVKRAAVFSNWLGVRKAILVHAEGRKTVVLDLTHTRLVDHSTMEKLHELQVKLELAGKRLSLAGLEGHRPLSKHPHAARRSGRIRALPRQPIGTGP
jgi:MFS superfamily sulfate permease-like transporter